MCIYKYTIVIYCIHAHVINPHGSTAQFNVAAAFFNIRGLQLSLLLLTLEILVVGQTAGLHLPSHDTKPRVFQCDVSDLLVSNYHNVSCRPVSQSLANPTSFVWASPALELPKGRFLLGILVGTFRSSTPEPPECHENLSFLIIFKLTPQVMSFRMKVRFVAI